MPLEHKAIVWPEVSTTDIPTTKPGFHASYWEILQAEWTEIVQEYEEDPDTFYRAWHYLNDHPMFWRFRPHNDTPDNHVMWLEQSYGFGSDGINMMVMLVDETGTVNEDESKNVNTEVWLEAGKWYLLPGEHENHVHEHDYELDCGGATYEEAVVKLARLVHERYGNDRVIADSSTLQVPARPPVRLVLSGRDLSPRGTLTARWPHPGRSSASLGGQA